MPTPRDQIPADATALARKVAALERAVTELRATRRLEQASIGAGGLTIRGGNLYMTTPAGVRALLIGNVGIPHLDGSQQQGSTINREDGSVAFAVYAQPQVQGSDAQAWTLWDRSDNTIASEDTLSGQGLARPYLSLPWTSLRFSDWPTTTGAAFTDILHSEFPKQAPYAYISLGNTSTVSGTTGQAQLTINGTAWGTPINVGFVVNTSTIGPFPLPGNHMDPVTLRVQAKRTAGTGSINVQVLACNTMQS